MIDDFGVGPRRRQTPYDVPPQRQPQLVRLYKQPAMAGNSAGNDEAAVIAAAFDDPIWSGIDLPAPVIEPSDDDSGNIGPEAGNGDGTPPDNNGNPTGDDKSGDSGNRFKRAFSAIAGKLSRKQWLLAGGAALILIGGSTSAFLLTRPGDNQNTKAVSTAKPKPKPTPPPPPPVSPLTGVEVPLEDTKRPVTGVMIENSTNARPQSGLTQAGVVFEAIAEYGITRFLALYQEGKPGNLGPVRSVRPYYVDWAKTYDAPIAHVGGSPDALAKIKAEGVKDLDQFFNAPYYHRISSRYAPHNMYTNMTELDKAKTAKGWTTSAFTGFPRKKDAPVAVEKRTANKVDIAISGPTYNVHYDYDPDNNRYLRTMGGTPHIDADSSERIGPKVVVALATAYGLEPDGYHSKYQIAGSGHATVFQDGVATPVTWTRDTAASQYVFKDAAGKPFALNAGQTWITVVGSPTAITHAP